ncbi:MAG: AsmA family protein [Xanthobacteraceae bacterium]
MQTTLLALSIAIILALVAALAGPYFVDWSQYHEVFEAQATQLAGMPVRITGAIDARILPTPSLTLHGIEAGPRGREPRLRARELAIELRLGPLMRGKFSAAEMRLVGPEIRAGLDAAGRFDWPAAQPGLDPELLSIDGLSVEDGRATLTEAGSGARLVLDGLWFRGELRSLLGPVKGEGGFLVDDDRFGYRLAVGRLGDEAGVRIRLAIDPSDRPLTVEADGALRIEQGTPRFDGALTLARPQGVTASSPRDGAGVPWRAVAKVKASAAAALFEQVDLQYGTDENGLKLSGAVEIKLGRKPRFEGVLSARQIDVDGVLDLPDSERRLPLMVIKRLAEGLAGRFDPPIPGRLGIGIDTLTLAGAQIHAVRGDLKTDAAGWDLETLEFRAPGSAQTRVSGRIGFAPKGLSFSGPAAVEAGDARPLLAWLEGAPDGVLRQVGSLRVSGDVQLEPGRVAIERLKADVDRHAVTGRLAYSFAAGRPTRLEAALKAAELDIDGVLSLARASAGGNSVAPPAELALALDIDAATVSGVVARSTTIKLTSDAAGLVLEKFQIADLGGAAIDLSGRIEQPTTSAPHGALTLDLDAHSLDGPLALLSRVAAPLADRLRPVLTRLLPLKARATLSVSAGALRGSATKLVLEGTAGPVRLALTGESTGGLLAADQYTVSARAAADDGGALVALLGLDRAAVVDKSSATLALTLRGTPSEDLRVDARLSAGGLVATAAGKVHPGGDDGMAAALDLWVAAANASWPRPDGAPPAPTLPVALRAHLNATGNALSFENLSGTVAGTPLRGRLDVALGAVPRIEGRIDADAIDAASAIGLAIGMPPRKPGDATPWPSESFGPGVLDGATGRIEFSVPRANLAPAVVARSMHGTLRFGHGEVAIEDLEGQLAAGRLQGQLVFSRIADGVAAHVRLDLTDADATVLVRGGARPPVVGRLSLQLEGDGNGFSPATLIGSLSGSGVVTLDRGQFAALDPRVFEAVTRAVDQGLVVDPARIAAVVATALDGGDLRVARSDGAVTVASGQMRIANVIAHADHADLTIGGSLDIAEGALDARLVLSGPPDRDTGSARPDVFIGLRGPVAAPKRTIDVSALAGWLTLRAVDRETKRIEALEAERRESALRPGAPPPAPDKQAVPANANPLQAQPPPQTAPVAQPPRAASPETAVAPAEAAPALPPPVDVRPAPGTRRPHGPRPRPEAAPARRTPSLPLPATDPPAARSYLDTLIGSHR